VSFDVLPRDFSILRSGLSRRKGTLSRNFPSQQNFQDGAEDYVKLDGAAESGNARRIPTSVHPKPNEEVDV